MPPPPCRLMSAAIDPISPPPPTLLCLGGDLSDAPVSIGPTAPALSSGANSTLPPLRRALLSSLYSICPDLSLGLGGREGGREGEGEG